MTWSETFERTAEHYARLAMTRGLWQYAQAQVVAMEQEQHGLWLGLRAAVGRRIKSAGFRPHPSDLVACDRQPEPLQSARRWNGR